MYEDYETVKQALFFKRFTRTASSFETALWNLFDASDWSNKSRLGISFPVQYQVYRDWYECEGGERVFFKEYLKDDKDE